MSLGFEFRPLDAQIEFLLPELERLTSGTKFFQRHAQHVHVKFNAGRLIDGSQNKMIQLFNHGYVSPALPTELYRSTSIAFWTLHIVPPKMIKSYRQVNTV